MFGKKKTGSAGELQEQVVAWRRHVHAHPELSYEESETTEFIERELRSMGLAPTRFRLGTGLWVDVPAADGATATDLVALRADIDALPMSEDSGESFASEVEGVCHSCGHDAHTAMLLGAASLLAADPPPRPVRLIFQPAEETMPGGAKDCKEEGVLEGVDRVFAVHCDPHRRTGEIGIVAGPVTSSNAKIGIHLRSPGGHTARPHQTGDTVFAAAQVVVGVTAIMDRRVDPRAGGVLTFGSIHAGKAVNVIPAEAEIWGTLRSATREVWALGEELVTEAVAQVVAPYHVEAEVEYHQGPPPVVNDAECAELARAAVEQVYGESGIGITEQSSGGEDFAWFLEDVPGVYLRFGVWDGEGEQTDLHHPAFRIDESGLGGGARLFDAFARLDRS